SEIAERSNGRINLKKPSVYSNLTRMEKQGYISSYLQNSDFGPNRKYYSLTDAGREFYQELKDYFDRNNIDVFKDFNDGDTMDIAPSQILSSSGQEEEIEDVAEEEVDIKLNGSSDEDFFDFSFASENEIIAEEDEDEFTSDIEDESPAEEQQDDDKVTAITESPAQQSATFEHVSPAPQQEATADVNKYSIRQALLHHEDKPGEQPTTDGGVFLSQESADEYNKRIYDISKDINRYRKKRSFAEDQISMATADALVASKEKMQTNIDDFKNALLQNKEKYQDQRFNKDEFDRHMTYRYDRNSLKETPQQEQAVEEIKNDAVYITGHLNSEDIEKPRKITPPQLKIVSQNSKETKLPAPKRDATVDPSHKEILSNLYCKTKDSICEEREDALYDYNDLQDYYKNQEISFSIYQKPAHKLKHNTNKLYMIVSIILFLVEAAFSVGTYFILKSFDYVKNSTSFLYILLPALLLIDMIVMIFKYKQSSGWLPRSIMPQWLMWLLYLLSTGAVVGLNFAFGCTLDNFIPYMNTLILPIIFVFIVFPCRFYSNRIAIIRHWK
ncbi:MAG: helix-turn-helix transcriptional regulator, partial [Clostridia bacterium]|nr:helix-turn-helix transcriptional regulator [Clostridia bacterium]